MHAGGEFGCIGRRGPCDTNKLAGVLRGNVHADGQAEMIGSIHGIEHGETMRPSLCPILPRVHGGVSADVGVFPIRLGTVGVLVLYGGSRVGGQQPIAAAGIQIGAVSPLSIRAFRDLLPQAILASAQGDEVPTRGIKSGGSTAGEADAFLKEEGLCALATETSHD
jgi:hypothetical protein